LILYLDSSAIVAHYFNEPHTVSVLQALPQADLLCTTQAAYAEVRAAFAQLRHHKRLVGKRYYEAVNQLEADWPDFERRDVTDEVTRSAGIVAELYLLKGYDSIHLASALISKKLYADLQFLSYDVRLNRTASNAGLVLWT
jgi:uncharacterized protein